MKYLICWIGLTDIKASQGTLDKNELGPVGQAILDKEFDKVILLSDHKKVVSDCYLKWMRGKSSTDIELSSAKLSSPTDFGDIYKAALNVLIPINLNNKSFDLTYHLSPGTPAMAAVWVILSKTRFPAELLESSKHGGVKTVSVPFDISAEFIPDLFRRPDSELVRLTEGLPPEAPEFEHIFYKSNVMKSVVGRARRVAPRTIPVLLEGESGTGKELFARAIHQSSPRANNAFISVNCGAIPADLVESVLFGHKKGSFTGAIQDHKGYFEAADGGTLFLDEIGELPLNLQVRLLRVIQESEVVPVGEIIPRKIDIRIITATNRTLSIEMKDKRFREDLYYRIAVAVIKLPPLRTREGDIGLLIDALLKQVNEESRFEPGYEYKKISTKARNLMLNHAWPGNVRELLNTIRSAAVWCEGENISEADVKDALITISDSASENDSVMDKNIEEGIDLKEIISDVANHYLSLAMNTTAHNKTKAAELLGLGNYQTLTNWIEKYGSNK